MKRRKFITNSVASGSACALAGNTVFAVAPQTNSDAKAKVKCKITFTKRNIIKNYSSNSGTKMENHAPFSN